MAYDKEPKIKDPIAAESFEPDPELDTVPLNELTADEKENE